MHLCDNRGQWGPPRTLANTSRHFSEVGRKNSSHRWRRKWMKKSFHRWRRKRKSFPPLKKELKKVNKVVNMKSRGKLGIDSGVIGEGSGGGRGGPGSGRRGRGNFSEKKSFSTLLIKKSSFLYRETLLAKHGKMNDTPSQRAHGTWGHGVCTHTGWEVKAAPGSSYSGAKLKVNKSSFA